MEERTAGRTGGKPSAKKQGNGAALKSGAIILVLVLAMVGYYYYLSNRQKEKDQEDTKLTVVQELLMRDLKNNYPPTVKEVIKYYSELTKCFYNEQYTDEELEQLAAKARELYDDELKENNDWSKYIIQLQSEISDFKGKSIRVSSYSLPASTDVYEFRENGSEFARIYCTYLLSSGSEKRSVEEIFLLRKDEDGHWKIFGWDLAKNVNIQEQEETSAQ